MDLFEKVAKLKKDLKDYYNNYTQYNCSINEALREYDVDTMLIITRSLEGINDGSIKELSTFLQDCCDIEEVYDKLVDENFDVSIKKYFNPAITFLHRKNYNINLTPIKLIEAEKFNLEAITSYVIQMTNAFENENYGNVNSLSISTLQSLFLEICHSHNKDVGKSPDMPTLTKKALEVLNMDIKKYIIDPNDKDLKKFISSIHKIASGLVETRNSYSDSHGKHAISFANMQSLPQHHYRLIMESTIVLVNFLISSYEYQNKK